MTVKTQEGIIRKLVRRPYLRPSLSGEVRDISRSNSVMIKIVISEKYDDDVANDLKILEELYYHTKEDNRYISELKKALIETGIYVDDESLGHEGLDA